MMKCLRPGFFTMLLLLTAISGVVAAPVEEIEQVEISIRQEDRLVTGEMENRVIASIRAVSEKLLIGRKASDVELNRKRFEDIIRQVFDRVLYGYELSDISITPAKTTVISLKMLPWGEVVQSTAVQIDFGDFAEADKTLLMRDLAGIEQNIAQILIGLPVDAFAWADSVSRVLIREAIAVQLPEFKAEIEYLPAKHTTVNIKLQPIGPLIRKTEVRLHSDTIPKLLLFPVNSAAEAVVDKLNGLPVAFVQRHREEYNQRMQSALDRSKYVSKYHLNTELSLDLGERVRAEVRAETKEYNLNLEGVLDLGREGNENTLLRGHTGYVLKHNDELFLDVEFFPNTINWHVQPGYGRQLSPKMYMGLKHDLGDNEDIGILRHKLNDDLWLNVEQNFTTGYQMTGIRYQLHDYLAAEAINDQNGTWLRLIADL